MSGNLAVEKYGAKNKVKGYGAEMRGAAGAEKSQWGVTAQY